MPVQLTPDDLRNRPARIREILEPIVNDINRLNIRPISTLSDYVIGPVPFGGNFSSVTDPSEFRVPTDWDSLYFNYHEIWRYDGRKFYLLNRAYLHFYLALDGPESEVQSLSLHCDPMMLPTEAAYEYKRGPHLHFGGANPDVSRAHISLCVGDAQNGGNNVAAVMNKFKQAIRMIAVEILPRYSP